MGFTTLVDLLHKTTWRHPDHPFLYWLDRKRGITYAEAVSLSDQAAAGFAHLGIRRGDRVGIFAHNGLDYVIAMLGAWKLGAISTHISVLQAVNLAYYVNDSTPKVLVYTGDMHDVISQNKPNMPSLKHTICMDGPKDGSLGWNEILKAGYKIPAAKVDAMDGCHLSYTSGSSGAPKGALLAHGFVVRATHCIAERLGLSSVDVTLGPTSLSSSFHFVANLLPGLHGACQVGMMSKWNPEAAWDDMEQRRVSMVVGNPLLYADLLNICRHKGRKPSALRIALSGGAPVPPDLKRAFVDELGIFLVESYGQSELGGFVGMGFPRREPEERLFAIGPSLPDREVIIADEKDREVPIGEIGQMLIRDGVMLGYWNMPEKTADALKNGWLHTGDMGRMDSEGYITMVGRWSERIVCDGRIIFPRRIEEALLRHPSVRYACVIGRADKAHGELIKGLVELYPEKPAKEKELVEFCRSQLDAREVPAILEILEQMPMTPTGKIGRADLQKREKSLKG